MLRLRYCTIVFNCLVQSLSYIICEKYSITFSLKKLLGHTFYDTYEYMRVHERGINLKMIVICMHMLHKL